MEWWGVVAPRLDYSHERIFLQRDRVTIRSRDSVMIYERAGVLLHPPLSVSDLRLFVCHCLGPRDSLSVSFLSMTPFFIRLSLSVLRCLFFCLAQFHLPLSAS